MKFRFVPPAVVATTVLGAGLAPLPASAFASGASTERGDPPARRRHRF